MKKISIIIVITIISGFLGLFILPLKVETTRWVTVEDMGWEELFSILQDNSTQPQFWNWDGQESANSIVWVESGTTFQITEEDKEDKELLFSIRDAKEEIGNGRIYLEEIPQGLWLRCYYTYQADYSPFSRFQDWIRRGEIALDIDKALLRIKEKVKAQKKIKE